MKNFLEINQEKKTASFNLSAIISHLMPAESSHGSFEHVNLKGRNVGPAMIMRRGNFGESQDYSINIYINNNIQGVSNSILVGSQVNMGDPGVCLSFKDVKLDREMGKNRRRSESARVIWGILLFAFISLLLLLSLTLI